MFIEQLSIFLENRPGKLKGITDILKRVLSLKILLKMKKTKALNRMRISTVRKWLYFKCRLMLKCLGRN